MNKRIIVFVTHRYPPAVGGMQKQSFELIKGISRELPSEMIVWHNSVMVAFFLLWSIKRKLKKIVKQNDIALVHLNDGLLVLALDSIRKVTSAPVFCTMHGLDVVFPSKFYQKRLIQNASDLNMIISVSEATKSECVQRGIPGDKVKVIHNGVDKEKVLEKKDPFFIDKLEMILNASLKEKIILLSVGRPVKRKGISWFIENVMPRLNENIIFITVGASLKKERLVRFMLKALPKRMRELIALMFGIGLDEPRQLKLTRCEKLKNRVFLLGKVNYEDLIQLYKHAYLFIMPNIPVEGDMEGFGITALEASVNGAVVLASDLEGIRDPIKNGINGFLLEPKNADAWIEKIESLLSDRQELVEMAESFKQYSLQKFGWDRMTAEYKKLFSSYI
ncbi:MAG: glycosyltransferase family 4 protein [Candidatus Aminicenantes bacterium]|nr:glycosyltransferase family 4 protein [Candidatus Aminicenantes bacterium]